MKLSLYPTADGGFRPPQVQAQIRAWQDAGRIVAVASADPALTGLDGVIPVGTDWVRVPNHRPRPDCLVIDALDLGDPDGQELVCRQQGPMLLPGTRLQFVLDALGRQGADGVLLVLSGLTISPAWQAQLVAWAGQVRVHWDLATAPWRITMREAGPDMPARRMPDRDHERDLAHPFRCRENRRGQGGK